VKIKINDITQCEKELVLTIDAKDASADYNSVLAKFKNYVTIPGFRKGKAPLGKVERMYGDHAKEEFYNQKIGDYFKKALEERQINPVNQGEAKDVKWEKGTDLVVTFSYEIMPEVKVSKYKELEVPFEKTKFKKAMIDETIEEYRNKMATETDAEDGAVAGDIIKSVFKFLDDEGNVTKEINREFALGDNSYSKAFNKNLTGKKVGDEVKTKLFTKTQQSDDKEIIETIKDRDFLVSITSVKRRILPELNDEFAKDLGFDTLDLMKESMEQELKKKIKNDDKRRLQDSIIMSLTTENPFDVPASMVKNYAENMAKSAAEQYKMEVTQLIPMYMQAAEFNIKSHFILDEIKKMEDIKITDAEKDKVIADAAENMKMDSEQYKKLYKKQIESEDFIHSLGERKLMDKLEKYSKIVPYPKEEAKPDTKKEEK
jgi:trigger factor